MLLSLVRVLIVLGVGSTTVADGLAPFPTQVPPIVCTAVVTDAGTAEESSEWHITLTVPKIQWEIVGELAPKKEWPQLKAEVEEMSLDLRLGGHSQLSESRVVDTKGKELSRDQLLERLAKETPVLLSVSGHMPEAYFLQLTSPEALIVVLGPRDGYPASELLPARKTATGKVRKDGEK